MGSQVPPQIGRAERHTMSTCILHIGENFATCAIGRTCQGNRVEVYPEPEAWEDTPF